MATFSFRCTDADKQQISDMLLNYAAEEKGKIILEKLKQHSQDDMKKEIESLNAKISDLQQQTSHLQAVNGDLQVENEHLQDVNKCLQTENERLQNVNENLQTENNDLQEKNKELQDVNVAIQEAYKKQTAEQTEDELHFAVPEPAKSLLNEYAHRLNVTQGDILIDMFIRYVTEQYNHWFFDFLVKKSEFKEVCGYTHQEVLKWLNANK